MKQNKKEKYILKSYKIHFETVKTRTLTKSKKDIIFNSLNFIKSRYNSISYQLHNNISWKNMKDKDYSKLVRKSFEYQLQDKISSGYAQNIFKNILGKYIETKKSYYSKYTQNNIKSKNKHSKKKKHYFKKPYFEDIIEFPLDNRMLTGSGKKAFQKDKNIDNLYWFSFLNPFKNENTNYKKNINIPIFIYPEIKKYIDLGYKIAFSIHKDYLKLTFHIPELDIRELNKNKKKLEKIAVDFGKYISTYDGKQSKQFNLSKMYRKINKILGQIKELQRNLQILRDNKDFGIEYKEIKYEIQRLNKRISGIRKSSYGQIKNYLSNNYNEIIIEDLNFKQIEKKEKNYKGKNFNKILRIMGRSIWIEIIKKIEMVGNHLTMINPKYTSQACSSCGHVDRKNRQGRLFHCQSCGSKKDADINAAINLFYGGIICSNS